MREDIVSLVYKAHFFDTFIDIGKRGLCLKSIFHFGFMKTGKQRFIEREVKVIFDEEWTVIKLDEHKYYKRLSGLGIRGVDFLAVHPEFGLALIEFKNYIGGEMSIPDNVDQKMIEKKNDTIRLIHIINKYFQRQFYFRFLTFIGWEYLYPKEWKIWISAKKHLDKDNVFFIGVIDH